MTQAQSPATTPATETYAAAATGVSYKSVPHAISSQNGLIVPLMPGQGSVLPRLLREGNRMVVQSIHNAQKADDADGRVLVMESATAGESATTPAPREPAAAMPSII